MKKLLFLLAIIILFQFCSCTTIIKKLIPSITESATEATTMPTEVPTEAPTKVPTEAPTEAPTKAPTEPPTQAPTLTPTQNTPYLKSIPAEVCIFAQPDPDSAYTRNIGEDGVFTIVEEYRHANGDLWGRLKSGVGWVNLSDFFCDGSQLPPVTASYSSDLILSGNYHLAGLYTYEDYKVDVTFYAHETVSDFRIYDYNPVAHTSTELLYTLDMLTPQKPLVAHLKFPGDFSTFYITFTDSSNQWHAYRISQSGRDGLIQMLED